ncbi:MAG: hypothetical protein WC951_14180 [Bacteroidales bacterium]
MPLIFQFFEIADAVHKIVNLTEGTPKQAASPDASVGIADSGVVGDIIQSFPWGAWLLRSASRRRSNLMPSPTQLQQNPFPLVFNVLPNKFFRPWPKRIIPALGMEIKHSLFWECPIFNCFDDIFCGMVTQFNEFRIGNRVFFGGFVADVVEVAHPSGDRYR